MIEIIAEIGVNHDGNVDLAMHLVNEAKIAGADVAKFQVWNSENVLDGDDYDLIKPLELTQGELCKIKMYCDSIGIEFMATPDELDDALFLKSIGVKRIKIGSQNILNLPMLRHLGKLDLPVILSTGAATDEEIKAAFAAVWNGRVSLLHCVSAYPAPIEQMNLLVIQRLKKFVVPVGLSDHTTESTAAVLAVALGATIFEKHLTHDRFAGGPDHISSLEPYAFSEYVRHIREAGAALGSGHKKIMPCELTTRAKNLRLLSNYADIRA